MRRDVLAGIALLAVLAWPVASHAAALAGRLDLMPAITATMGLALLFLGVIRATRAGVRIALVLAMVAVAATWALAPRVLLFVAPAAITAAVGAWFAVSLAPEHEPRVATYARREHGGALPADVARYARRLTLAWALLLFASAAASLLLAALAPVTVWSAYANLGSYAIIAAFFVAEYLWRRLRFPAQRHASFLAHVRNVIDRP